MHLRRAIDRVAIEMRPLRRTAMLGMIAVLGIGVGTSGARAQSGDFPVNPGNPGEVPTYTITADDCNTIRNALAPTNPPPFDLVVACSIQGRGVAGRQTPCDLLGGGVNVGVPLGQCQDSFPIPLTTPDPDNNFLERNVNLAATAAGQNLALGDGDRVSVTSVSGGAGVVLGPIRVQAGTCQSGECQANCGGIKVVQSATACNEVTEQLANSVLADPPELSHALFLDVQQTATSGFLTAAVCPNYKWTCDSAAAPPVGGTDYLGQLGFSIAFTPVCFRTSRLTYCCATRADGSVVKPCPK